MSGQSIVISTPNPAWPEQFQALAGSLRAVLGPRAGVIHHIGSTSVPGLAAKNVIDLQLSLPQLAGVDELAPALLELGLTLRPGITADHQPPGLSLPPPELAKRYACIPGRLHVHIRQVGRFNQRYPLLMRDFLRAHPTAAAAYGEVKVQLARLHPADADAYYAVKDPVMDLIVAGAEAWARRVGWHLPPSDA